MLYIHVYTICDSPSSDTVSPTTNYFATNKVLSKSIKL